MFVKTWICLVGIAVFCTELSQAWGDRKHRYGPPHNYFGPPHHNYGSPHHGPSGPPHHNYGPPHHGSFGPPKVGPSELPHHHWYFDSGESSESDSDSWSDSDNSGSWNFPCHHDHPRWPPKPTASPKPKPTPKPNPNPNPGPFPNPKPTAEPFPNPNPNPGPFPNPNPTSEPFPNPKPSPGPFPNPNPNPGPFPNPNPTSEPFPNPNPNPGPFPNPNPNPGTFPNPNPNPEPFPNPRPNPGPFPNPNPNPELIPQPTPGPFPQPTPGPTPSPRQPDPDVQICLTSCPVTAEYNPICGTDGVTYPNPGRLECAKMCGVDVQLSRASRCPTNGGGTTNPPTQPLPDVQACMRSCPVTSEYNPVCGSDGVTYTNPGRLECAQNCGVDVQLSRASRCPTSEARTPSPSLPDIQACIRSCPVTSEFNPVCGTDGITYTNPGRLECARLCGVDVQLSRMSRCPTNNGGTTSPPSRPLQDIQACIRNCPVTSEFNPVCGTDGVTYTNPGRLECARLCGVDVTLSRRSRCPPPQPTPDPTTKPTPTVPFREPLTQTTPSPVVRPVTPPVSPGVDFTIDQALLDEIFTTQEPDLSGLIDERHQDSK